MARLRPKGHSISIEIIGGGKPKRNSPPALGYRVTCQCGWSSLPHRIARDCTKAFNDHIATVAAGRCIGCGEAKEIVRGRMCMDCAYDARCAERSVALTKDEAATRKRAREHNIKSKYGLTPETVDLMIQFQGSKCRICDSELVPNSKVGLHIDHCHVDGRVRGLLCSRCNQGLGQFDDNPTLLLNAARYLVMPGSESKSIARVKEPERKRPRRPTPPIDDVAVEARRLARWLADEVIFRASQQDLQETQS